MTVSSLTTKFRIVAVNDIYQLENLPKLKSLLSRLTRSTTDLAPSAVVLAGDFLSPGRLSAVDCGRGMVEALTASGITHACLGNHEADLVLPTLEDRIRQFSGDVRVINTNLRPDCLEESHWLKSVCSPYEIVTSQCGKVNFGMLGILSDESPLYIGGDFHRLPLGNVLESYSDAYQKLIPTKKADCIVSLTHQTIDRDRDLARHILEKHSNCGHQVLIGGHEHDQYIEVLEESGTEVHIVKSGQDAEYASIIDLDIDLSSSSADNNSKVSRISTELVDLRELPDATSVKSLVQTKMKGLKRMEQEIIVDDTLVSSDVDLCSLNSQTEATTFGTFAADAIRAEMRSDLCLLPGEMIQGNSKYERNIMTYKQIREEFPSKIRIVSIPMTISEVKQALKEGSDNNYFMHVNADFDSYFANSENQVLQVAVHMPLLKKNSSIPTLESIGERLAKQKLLPGKDDWIPGLFLVTRYCCHARWSQIFQNFEFDDLDVNNDGVLDSNEIKQLMTKVLGHEPEDYAVDDMIRAIDEDENGVIDRGEFMKLLEETKRLQ